MRKDFTTEQTEALERGAVALTALLSWLRTPLSPGDRILLLTQCSESARAAYVAAGTLLEYERRALGRVAAAHARCAPQNASRRPF